MVTLEQVKLLETKIAKAIEYVKRQSEENALLREKLDGYRARIDELEVLIQHFKFDQGRIEAGIVSALNRLNQFEDAMEEGLSAAMPMPSLKTGAPAGTVDPSAFSALTSDEGISTAPPVSQRDSDGIETLDSADTIPNGSLSPSDEEILSALEAEGAIKKKSQAEIHGSEVSASAHSGAELDIF